MLKLPTKIDNKIILIAPLLLGVYLAVMYPLHIVLLAFISAKFGDSTTNYYPMLTAFILFIASIVLAVFLNKLLLKRHLTYDEKLTASLTSNVAFNFTLALLIYLIGESLLTSFLSLIILSFSGFFVAALATVVIEYLEAKYLQFKSN
ncbi:hypothetical protein [Pontibacter burrus]|uniref:Uncharacterized protein n=1 Tax=Pontibacter burrus TaxID=2704466 RepID=A0A6B3LU75_9BACT|nr:hypothetical protein [Pontibacter burrus]NEM97796.1 hypothetical protein [Pontibacter burrus]